MPTYQYRCPDHGDFEEWHSITEDHPTSTCDCGQSSLKVFTPPRIAADALPSKLADVRAVDATEARWAKDMPAYKRLRDEGLQPQSIDGAARWEAVGTSAMEINSKGIVSGPEHRIQEAMEMAREARSA